MTGRKPFSVVRVEETKKKNGIPATHLEVWMAGYSKDNKPNTDKVAEVMAKEEAELPEYILGTVRLNRVKLDSAVPFEV
ncbi:unnamed protein product [Camellia sinensis]